VVHPNELMVMHALQHVSTTQLYQKVNALKNVPSSPETENVNSVDGSKLENSDQRNNAVFGKILATIPDALKLVNFALWLVNSEKSFQKPNVNGSRRERQPREDVVIGSRNAMVTNATNLKDVANFLEEPSTTPRTDANGEFTRTEARESSVARRSRTQTVSVPIARNSSRSALQCLVSSRTPCAQNALSEPYQKDARERDVVNSRFVVKERNAPRSWLDVPSLEQLFAPLTRRNASTRDLDHHAVVWFVANTFASVLARLARDMEKRHAFSRDWQDAPPNILVVSSRDVPREFLNSDVALPPSNVLEKYADHTI
jgi:hypothetical protein